MKRTFCLLFTLAAVGCNDNEGTTTPPATTPPPATPTSPPPPSTGGTTPATMTVMVGPNGSIAFVPSSVTINVGDTVTWQWGGGALSHTVTSGSPGAPDGRFCSNGGTQSAAACAGIGFAQTGGSFSHTFTTAGTFPYFCAVHGAAMTGTVTVH
jgi:plastocyanin